MTKKLKMCYRIEDASFRLESNDLFELYHLHITYDNRILAFLLCVFLFWKYKWEEEIIYDLTTYDEVIYRMDKHILEYNKGN